MEESAQEKECQICINCIRNKYATKIFFPFEKLPVELS